MISVTSAAANFMADGAKYVVARVMHRLGITRTPTKEELKYWMVDLMAMLLMAHRWAGMEISALATVYVDPFSVSRRAIPVHGRGGCDGAAVTRAACTRNDRAERARRAVAWCYRWHDALTPADLNACFVRFGLGELKGFTVQLHEAAGWTHKTVMVRGVFPAGARGCWITNDGLNGRDELPPLTKDDFLVQIPLDGLSLAHITSQFGARAGQKSE